MNINEGDIIYSTCPDMVLCYHVGILVVDNGKPMVYHNTPMEVNQYGGNIVAQSLNDFTKARKITKVIPAGILPDQVRRYSFENRERKWEVFYNCEDFVNVIQHGQKRSPLRGLLIAGITFSLLTI